MDIENINDIEELKFIIKKLDEENDFMELQYGKLYGLLDKSYKEYKSLNEKYNDLFKENNILKQKIRYGINALEGKKKRAL